MLKKTRKQNAPILHWGSHVRLLRPDELFNDRYKKKKYLQNSSTNAFFDEEWQKEKESTWTQFSNCGKAALMRPYYGHRYMRQHHWQPLNRKYKPKNPKLRMRSSSRPDRGIASFQLSRYVHTVDLNSPNLLKNQAWKKICTWHESFRRAWLSSRVLRSTAVSVSSAPHQIVL